MSKLSTIAELELLLLTHYFFATFTYGSDSAFSGFPPACGSANRALPSWSVGAISEKRNLPDRLFTKFCVNKQEGNGPIDFGRQGQWKIWWTQKRNLTSDLNQATLITLVYMCILPLRPWWPPNSLRSHLSSALNSVTSTTYVSLASNCYYSPNFPGRRRRRPNMIH